MGPALSAFGLKRIADMDRAELVATINSLYRTLLIINGRTLGEDRTALPHSEVDQYQAVLERWFTGDADPAQSEHPASQPES